MVGDGDGAGEAVSNGIAVGAALVETPKGLSWLGRLDSACIVGTGLFVRSLDPEEGRGLLSSLVRVGVGVAGS